MKIVEYGKVRDKASYQIRSKPQVPNNEGRRTCQTVEEVLAVWCSSLPHAGHVGSTDGSSLF